MAVEALLAFACFFCTFLRSSAQNVRDDPNVKIDLAAAVNTVLKSWTNDTIDRVELMYITTNSTTRVSVSSSLLESAYDCKLVMRYFPSKSPFNRLIETLSELHPEPSGKMADLRWACIFFDKSGQRVFGIYFDASGRNGIINGCCVRFASGALRKWGESHFGKIFG